jgi:hypothetical protein
MSEMAVCRQRLPLGTRDEPRPEDRVTQVSLASVQTLDGVKFRRGAVPQAVDLWKMYHIQCVRFLPLLISDRRDRSCPLARRRSAPGRTGRPIGACLFPCRCRSIRAPSSAPQVCEHGDIPELSVSYPTRTSRCCQASPFSRFVPRRQGTRKADRISTRFPNRAFSQIPSRRTRTVHFYVHGSQCHPAPLVPRVVVLRTSRGRRLPPARVV